MGGPDLKGDVCAPTVGGHNAAHNTWGHTPHAIRITIDHITADTQRGTCRIANWCHTAAL